MTGIFSFDGPMYCDRNGVYCNTTVTNEMLSRYFRVVDKLYVIMRTIHIDDYYRNRNLQRVETSDRLRIVEMPNLNTPINFLKRRKYQEKINQFVYSADLFFLRIPSIISNMVAASCRKFGKPYFAEVGGCAWDSYYNHGLLGKIIAPYMYYSEKKVVKEAAYSSYVTEKWLQNRYPTNGRAIIASNVYLSSFDNDNIRNRIRRYETSGLGKVRIGTIASVDVKYKGQKYVVKALGRLKKEGIIIDYDLVGGGDPAFLRKLAIKHDVADQVHFLGVKLHEDIWRWLDGIDVYAQPSMQEGLPRALIEAMNRGCLAIGSDTAGIPELLEDDMIFKSGSVSGICNVLKLLLSGRDYSCRILRNFEKSKEYKIEDLNHRRNVAFEEYRKLVEL